VQIIIRVKYLTGICDYTRNKKAASISKSVSVGTWV